ncbi:MAG TPA: sialidase family protein [Candidatus Brocadiia bacterium]|nr:sialidase family protein [Candidatus Brocadiia bacterium]
MNCLMMIFPAALLMLSTQDSVSAVTSDAVRAPLFVSGKDGYHTYRIPSVITTPKGTLLAFCEGRKKNRSDTGDIDLVMKRSSDGGATWSEQSIIWDDGPNTCGNPCPVIDRDTGTIWLPMTWNLGADGEGEIVKGTSKNTRRVFITRSDDDGMTWAKPVEITETTKKPEWSWYATGPGVGIQLRFGERKGRLVIPCDHNTKANPVTHHSHVIFSDDHGRTWQLGGATESGANECHVVELDDGSLLLNMRRARVWNEPYRLTSLSADEGATWSPLTFDKALIDPVCQGCMIRYELPDRSVILHSNAADGLKRIRMTVRISEDGGKTWAFSRALHEGPTAYSCLTRLPDGSVGCLYEAGVESPYETITFARFPLDWIKGGAAR